MLSATDQAKLIISRLKTLRESLGYSYQELATLTGLSKSTLQRYETGAIMSIPLNKIEILASALHTSPEYILGWDRKINNADKVALDLYPQFVPGQNDLSALSGIVDSERAILQKYRALDEHGTKAVDSILDIEYDRCTSSPKVISFPESTRVIPYSYIPASAGVGEWLDVENIDEIEIPDTAEYRNADFAVPVAGDSMEPTYSDGDVLLVHEQDAVNIGDIGLFAVNGHGYVKEMGNGVLISHNHEYDDIPIDESFKCFGKVIGKLK